MLEWTLGLLFIASSVLLAASIIKTHRAAKVQEERIDLAHISLVAEIKELKETVHKLELDLEIIKNEAGIKLSPHEILFRRDILDLYKRGYSIENIAESKNVPVETIEELLAPYRKDQPERSAASYENS